MTGTGISRLSRFPPVWRSALRGSGPDDATPGIVIDRPRPPRSPAAEVLADALDPYAQAERAAIMEFDGGLSHEAAERAAGLSIGADFA